MSGEWCTIESDPGVFTSLVESFGVKNVEFAELWSLDDESLAALTSPAEGVEGAAVHGLIFLFKWQQQSPSSPSSGGSGEGTPLLGDDVPEGLFFAKQVTHNACATQAILSVLFNTAGSVEEGSESPDDDCGRLLYLGPMLSNFRSFTSAFPPDLRGESIGASDEIREAHNSFGRAEDAFLNDPTKPKREASDDDDVFHFVAYLPFKDGNVYEIDGLKAGPVRVGPCRADGIDNGAEKEWLIVARDAVRARLEGYNPSEIKFNLMAMVQDRRTCLSEKLDGLVSGAGLGDDDPAVVAARSELAGEDEKRAKWSAENARRRHNFLPFGIELLRCLAGTGRFEEYIEQAKKTAGEKRKRAEAWKEKSKALGA
mmetsp:Transcript_3288/g.7302  ORF Transcript_3288/g.7302 Transcript_3288/m.7302 type:complete len:370 (+) Transcript_3288:84-1193(+)